MKWMTCLLFCLTVVPQVFGQEILRMISVDDQPIVVGRLNGKKAYFLVDSGSDITLLNANHSKKFGFKTMLMDLVDHELYDLSSKHKRKIKIAKKVALHLNKKLVAGRFLVLDIRVLANAIRSTSGIEISGIIGSDIMKRYAFLIDYGEREVRFTMR